MTNNTQSGQGEARRVTAADAILDVAEVLFGRHGIDGVSLRQISLAAGSANNSAVQYHFHDRDGLVRAIFARRLQSLERERALRLKAATSLGKDSDTSTLLRALLLPIADEYDSSGQCSFAAFLLGLRLFGELSEWQLYAEPAEVTRALDARLRASIPGMPADVFSRRLMCAVSVFLIAVVDWQRGVAGIEDRSPAARLRYLEQTLDFAAAGLLAPWQSH